MNICYDLIIKSASEIKTKFYFYNEIVMLFFLNLMRYEIYDLYIEL